MHKTKVVGVIQARLSSSRLPGKVLLPLGKEDNLVIDYVYSRLSSSTYIDEIYIATSNDKSDDDLANYCFKKNYQVFRGSLDDVLNRFSEVIKLSQASHIVRITGDCPLIEPTIIDSCIIGCIVNKCDLFGLKGNFPDGLDVQVFSSDSILTAEKKAKKKSEREHVGPYIEDPSNNFLIGGIEPFLDHYNYRFVIDEKEDYELLKKIFEELDMDKDIISITDIIDFVDKNPKLKSLNSHIGRNEGYKKSLENDTTQSN